MAWQALAVIFILVGKISDENALSSSFSWGQKVVKLQVYTGPVYSPRAG